MSFFLGMNKIKKIHAWPARGGVNPACPIEFLSREIARDHLTGA
jgi:hypothetical protein